MAVQRSYKFRSLVLPQSYIRITDLIWHRADDQWISVLGVFENANAAKPDVKKNPVPEGMLVDASGTPLQGAARDAKITELQANDAWPTTTTYPTPLDTFNGPSIPDDGKTHPKKLVYDKLMQDWADLNVVSV